MAVTRTHYYTIDPTDLAELLARRALVIMGLTTVGDYRALACRARSTGHDTLQATLSGEHT